MQSLPIPRECCAFPGRLRLTLNTRRNCGMTRRVHWSIRSAPGAQLHNVFRLAVLLMLSFSINAWSAELEVIKQKNCTVLLKSSDTLSKGQVLRAQSSSGRSVTLRIIKAGGSTAQARITPRGGSCTQISGQTLSVGSRSRGKKFNLGVVANVGQFTFRQPFLPFDPEVEPGSEEQKKPKSLLGWTRCTLLIQQVLGTRTGCNLLERKNFWEEHFGGWR